MKSVMISCRQRRETERPLTLTELAKVGIDPIVIESPCNPAGGPLNRKAAITALRAADGPCLFLEDDLLVNERLVPWFLTLAEAQDEVVTFTCFRKSLHPPECWSDDKPRLVQLVNTKQRRGFYGTQAVYLPHWVVNLALNRATDFEKADGSPLDECDGFDFWIKENIETILMAYPNPIDHRAPPKMREVSRGRPGNQRGHRSLSYGLGVRIGVAQEHSVG